MLTASDAIANDAFGSAVSLFGNTAVIGAPVIRVAKEKPRRGAAYVFVSGPPRLDCKTAVASAPNPLAVPGLFFPEHIEELGIDVPTVTITAVTQDKPVRRHPGAICPDAYLGGP